MLSGMSESIATDKVVCPSCGMSVGVKHQCAHDVLGRLVYARTEYEESSEVTFIQFTETHEPA